MLHGRNQISSFGYCNNASWARPSRHVEIRLNNSSCWCNLTRTGECVWPLEQSKGSHQLILLVGAQAGGRYTKCIAYLLRHHKTKQRHKILFQGECIGAQSLETWTPVGSAKTSSSRFFLANQQIHDHITNRRAEIWTSVTVLLAASQEWHNNWPRGGEVAEASKDMTLSSHPTHLTLISGRRQTGQSNNCLPN